MKRRLKFGFALAYEITEQSEGYEQGFNSVETEVLTVVSRLGLAEDEMKEWLFREG